MNDTRALVRRLRSEIVTLTADGKHAWRHVDEAVTERDAARATLARVVAVLDDWDNYRPLNQYSVDVLDQIRNAVDCS